MDVTGLSLSAAAALLRAGEVSSVQLTEAALERTGAADGKLHAFLHVDAAGAMLQARAADASFAAWRPMALTGWKHLEEPGQRASK